MKDVAGCDKLWGGAEQPLIQRSPNGETLLQLCEVDVRNALFHVYSPLTYYFNRSSSGSSSTRGQIVPEIGYLAN